MKQIKSIILVLTLANAVFAQEYTTSNHYVKKTDGTLVSHGSFLSTSFIEVSEGDTITRISQGYNVDVSSTTPIAYYNSGGAFISSYNTGYVDPIQDFIIPSGVSFIRVCGSVAAGLTVESSATNEPPANNGLSLEDFSITLRSLASFQNQPYAENNLGYFIHKPKTTGTAVRFYLIPNGTSSGVRTKFEMFATDYEADNTNYSGLNVLVYNDIIHFGTNKAGNKPHHKIIIGGKYTGSSLDTNSARTEYHLNNTVDFKGAKHTIEKVLNIKPSTEPQNPTKGDVYFDSTTNKLRVYNGTQWIDL